MGTIYDLDTPTVLIDLERLERNVAEMAALARQHGKALRPHTKTHKTPEIARMQLAAGAVGLTVAKPGEAEALFAAGCTDVFVAHEIVGESKIARLLDLAERGRILLGVDSVEVAEPISRLAAARGLTLPLRIEVDTGLGRAGTRSLAETLELARRIADLPGVSLEGIFTHEGHLYRAADRSEKSALAQAVVTQLLEVAYRLAEQGTAVETISVGSTPGAEPMALLDGPTELRPGVYVFNDRMQRHLGVAPDHCALTVLATVVSVRPEGRIITDAGSKSLAGDRIGSDTLCGEIVGHPELEFIGMSEEHGHLQAREAHRIRVGAKLRILPNHACTCVNQHDTLTAHRGERVEATWDITGRGKVR